MIGKKAAARLKAGGPINPLAKQKRCGRCKHYLKADYAKRFCLSCKRIINKLKREAEAIPKHTITIKIPMSNAGRDQVHNELYTKVANPLTIDKVRAGTMLRSSRTGLIYEVLGKRKQKDGSRVLEILDDNANTLLATDLEIANWIKVRK